MITIEDFQDYFLEFTDVHPYKLTLDVDVDDYVLQRIFIVENECLQKAFRQRTNLYIGYDIFGYMIGYDLENKDNELSESEFEDALMNFCSRHKAKYYYYGYQVSLTPTKDIEVMYDEEKNEIIKSLITTVKQINRRTGMFGYFVNRDLDDFNILIFFLEKEK